ncbi:TetR family transcriptional regulator [Streptomyces sp. NPDC047042]|uniref:TetR/AcrR family transcriptional regulator n=1 Tax=Streptomyces sp. NPDC047042 TaxID=3154807 RepID=UPI0033CAE99E
MTHSRTGQAAPVLPRPDGKGDRTRRRILVAARRTFAQYGYERATIRLIADAAEAHKSSVMQYFGTKEQLFKEAVRFDIPIDELTTPDPASTAENYLRTMLGRWASSPDSPMAVLVRTSMTSEEAAEELRTLVTTQSVDAIAEHIDLPDARIRAGLFSVMMLGIASGRYLLRVPDVSEPDLEDVVRVAAPVIRALISGEPEGRGCAETALGQAEKAETDDAEQGEGEGEGEGEVTVKGGAGAGAGNGG